MPLVGDFNMYGGIYRGVKLIVTESACISLQDYASPGVYLTQQQVSPDEAEISAAVLLSNRLAKRDVVVRVEVKDGQRVISRHEQQMTLEKEKDEKVVIVACGCRLHLDDGFGSGQGRLGDHAAY